MGAVYKATFQHRRAVLIAEVRSEVQPISQRQYVAVFGSLWHKKTTSRLAFKAVCGSLWYPRGYIHLSFFSTNKNIFSHRKDASNPMWKYLDLMQDVINN